MIGIRPEFHRIGYANPVTGVFTLGGDDIEFYACSECGACVMEKNREDWARTSHTAWHRRLDAAATNTSPHTNERSSAISEIGVTHNECMHNFEDTSGNCVDCTHPQETQHPDVSGVSGASPMPPTTRVTTEYRYVIRCDLNGCFPYCENHRQYGSLALRPLEGVPTSVAGHRVSHVVRTVSTGPWREVPAPEDR